MKCDLVGYRYKIDVGISFVKYNRAAFIVKAALC